LVVHPLEVPKKVPFVQILVKNKLIKHHFKVVMEDNMEIMAKITNKKINPMMVDKQALKEKGVMEVMAKVIKVSNQMIAQIANTIGNLDACQLIIIKGNMT
jgi:hypothetical protein